jgi:hypothetical protein
MQNSTNHIRFFWPHHFVLTPVLVGVQILSLYRYVNDISDSYFEILLAFGVLLMSFIIRIYATKNQDRIIRLELRLRYFQLTSTSFENFEKQLSKKQIMALRFASDSELLKLIDRTIENKLSSKEIKLAISNWQIDHWRV